MKFIILKGESIYSFDNEYLTEYTISNLPIKPKGEIEVTLHVDIDPNGVLKMKAVRKGRNEEEKEIIVDCGFKQIDEQLKKSMDKIAPYCPI